MMHASPDYGEIKFLTRMLVFLSKFPGELVDRYSEIMYGLVHLSNPGK